MKNDNVKGINEREKEEEEGGGERNEQSIGKTMTARENLMHLRKALEL